VDEVKNLHAKSVFYVIQYILTNGIKIVVDVVIGISEHFQPQVFQIFCS